MRTHVGYQRGLSLVELMVAIVIGLLLTAIVSQLFLGSKQTYRTQDSSARLQENARYALGLLTREIRMARYHVSDPNTQFATLLPVEGQNDTGFGASDEITVRYFGRDNSAGAAADGTVFDCLGTAAKRTTDLVVDRFYIAQDAANNNEPTLYCDNGAGGQPLVAGIESMHILFGEDTDADGTPNRFRPAQIVNMNNVLSVRLSLLLRTNTQSVATELDTKTYNHFGDAYAPGAVAPADDPGSVYDPADDRANRRLFSTVIGLRNKLD
ncbi:MAG: PilW family protein [Burkholderiales bacterium]